MNANSALGRRIATLALLWLAGVYMRAPILMMSALGARVREALGFGDTGLGALTTTPILMLGLGALPAAWLIGRFGARNTLVAAIALTAAASAARALAPDLVPLLVATAAMGLGIAAMQPALPALVGRWCPGSVALASAVYMNGMMVGEFTGAGLTLPLLLPAAGGDWRLALALFSLPVLIIAPALLWPTLHGTRTDMDRLRRRLPDWRDARMWLYGTALGATAATFFGINAYMSPLLARKGLAAELDLVLFVFNIAQLGGSLLMVFVARAVLRVPRLLFITLALHVAALTGFMTLDGLVPLLTVAFVLSLVAALQLIALTMLPPLLRGPDDAGAMAAGMFAIGYVLAFVIPLIAGAASDLFGRIDAALWVFLGCNLVFLPLAWRTPTRS